MAWEGKPSWVKGLWVLGIEQTQRHRSAKQMLKELEAEARPTLPSSGAIQYFLFSSLQPSAITSGKVPLSRWKRQGWRRGWYPLVPLESRLCSVAPAGGLSSIILPGMRWDGSWCSECSQLVDSWIRDVQNGWDLCATWGMGVGPQDGDGHSPAFALGVRRKATRSRSGCIFLERLPRSEMLALPPGSLSDPPAFWRETQSQWTQ